MKISVPLQNGWLPDRYTKHANDSDKIDGRPYVSFPINIEEVPLDDTFENLFNNERIYI